MLDEDMAEPTAGDLHQAAQHLGVVLIGQPVSSYFSLGSHARRDGVDYWLRLRQCHFLKWVPSRVLGYEDSTSSAACPSRRSWPRPSTGTLPISFAQSC